MKRLWIAGFFLVALLATSVVYAVPTGPSGAITPLSSGRYSTSAAQSTPATAGNVTEINLHANSVTQTWQGYFGNITGKIVLGDSNNKTLYDWDLASPQGEVYATRTSSTPAWASVRCADSSEVGTENTYVGASATSADRVNNTFFNGTSFNSFYVGSVEIASGADCFATNLYNSSSEPGANFAEVLLSDTTNLIYTSLLTQDSLGFDGRTHDFQMLVGENGHNGDSSSTTYYFYLELE